MGGTRGVLVEMRVVAEAWVDEAKEVTGGGGDMRHQERSNPGQLPKVNRQPSSSHTPPLRHLPDFVQAASISNSQKNCLIIE